MFKRNTTNDNIVTFNGRVGERTKGRLQRFYATSDPEKVRTYFRHISHVQFHEDGTLTVAHAGFLDSDVGMELHQLACIIRSGESNYLIGINYTQHLPLLVELYSGYYTFLPQTIQVYYGKAERVNEGFHRLRTGDLPVDIPNNPVPLNDTSQRKQTPALVNAIDRRVETLLKETESEQDTSDENDKSSEKIQ